MRTVRTARVRPLSRIFFRPPAGLPKFTAAFRLTVKQRKLKFTAKIFVRGKKFTAKNFVRDNKNVVRDKKIY